MGKENTQITVYKTGKGLLEANDALLRAHPNYWRHIHSRKSKDEQKNVIEEHESGIFLNAKDYSSGTGEKAKDAYMFIPATDLKYIHRQVFIEKTGELYKAEKIGKNIEGGKSVVTKIVIARYNTDAQGNIKNLPYSIHIENGTGQKAKNRNGGTYCKGGSYQCKKEVNINMSDLDCFTFFEEIYTLIRSFEQEYSYRWQLLEDLGTLFTGIKKVFGISKKSAA